AERRRAAPESKQAPPFDSATCGRYAQGERIGGINRGLRPLRSGRTGKQEAVHPDPRRRPALRKQSPPFPQSGEDPIKKPASTEVSAGLLPPPRRDAGGS